MMPIITNQDALSLYKTVRDEPNNLDIHLAVSCAANEWLKVLVGHLGRDAAFKNLDKAADYLKEMALPYYKRQD